MKWLQHQLGVGSDEGGMCTCEAPKGFELGDPKPKLLTPPKAGVEAAPNAGVLAPNAGVEAPKAGCTFIRGNA